VSLGSLLLLLLLLLMFYSAGVLAAPVSDSIFKN
jgi:hypothetical protein